MPYALLGPTLSIAGLFVLYVSIHGLPATMAALFLRSGTPDESDKPARRPARRRAAVSGRSIEPPEPPPAPPTRAGVRYAGVTCALLATLFAGLGSGYALGRAASAPANVSEIAAGATAASVSPDPVRTVAATATLAAGRDCSQIHRTDYLSDAERSWYLANCYEVEAAAVTVWTIATRICPSGLAFLAQEPQEPALIDRIVCARDNFIIPPEALRLAGPLICPRGIDALLHRVVMEIAGRRLEAMQLTCPA